MRKTTRYARSSALPAIAAALALSSTPLLAQEVPAQPTTPTTTAPAPVSADPAPVLDTATPPVSDTATPDVVTPTKTVAKPKRVATAKPVATRTVTQKTVTRTTHAAVPAAAAPVAAPAAPAAPATSQSAVKPIIDTSAAPAQPAQTAAAKPSGGIDNTAAMELGGGTLALIALGAGAWALSRRRHDEDEMVYEDTYEPEAEVVREPEIATAEAEPMPEPMAEAPRHDQVFEHPNIVAPAASAFAWGKPDPATQAEDDGSDRNPGETWVERAYRGQSPANPSASLKNRLRRAAFFDKRERDVAAGEAEPVDTDAGLPDAMVEEQERELA